ncbi:pilus assembly protein [Novosphingobium sp. 1949]|uniref:Pilus assembly protein n=1 Tax=Novosphingobium organovorum TaxID=2930092 RepID=A0ABT0B966_9SPHN|nr:TadE/TadG family type IV pilus assembly protein [Novosphingobium organovorum]MCJ2181617.1 pilus assembly protein [Novosphingobium organovorum]
MSRSGTLRARGPRRRRIARAMALGRAGLSDVRGVTALEFAVAGPILILLLLGCLDLGQMLYASALLRGAVQQVARDATLETADTDDLDTYLEKIVGDVAPGATFTISRKSYYDFSDVGRAESWDDSNDNDVCDDGEAYVDENGNGQWDEDIGVSGNGSASDSVLYTVTMTFSPLFPVPFLSSSSSEHTLTASAFKKNQPYASQDDYGSSAGTCD